MTQRYAFVLRPVGRYNAPPEVELADIDFDEKQAMVRMPARPGPGLSSRPARTVEVRCHGTAAFSRELTDEEQFHFDIYPVVAG